MQTKNIIQSNANVIRITNLQKGNVVKIVNQPTYSGGEPELLYGVVLDLFNDGDKTFIQMLEYRASYGAVDAQIKLHSGDKDLILFPAELHEVETYFQDAVRRMTKDVESAEQELAKKKIGLQKAQEFISGELSKKLTLASFEVVTDEALIQPTLEV